jgi:RNA polymerase sigma-70 factor, ECF subfamily
VELDNGDPAAGSRDAPSRFRALYESTFPDIYAFVARSAGAGSDTDDVVAEAYLVAWRRLNDVPPSPDDRLWMYGVARNMLARFRRTRQRRGQLFRRLSSEPDASVRPIEPQSRHPEVLDALSQLPSREREVVQLIYWDGLSQDEAATVIGCSANALRIRLHRAKKRLSRRLGTLEASAAPLSTELDLEIPK